MAWEKQPCRDLGLPTELQAGRDGIMREKAGAEGAAVLAQFHEASPFLKTLDKRARYVANSRGYVKTLSGRRCRFEKSNGRRQFTHKALNRIVQGSAADQMKYAMVALYKEGVPLLISIHDEIDVSIPKGDLSYIKNVSDIMANCVEGLNVPFVSDIEVGPTWGTAKEIEED